MRAVKRSDILDYQTYEDRREALRAEAMGEKSLRRVHAGDVLTFLFENTTTVRYQIQEMTRIERIVREAEIQHEIDTYNELLGGEGELGCTLLIEVDDPAERAVRLREWLQVPARLYVRLAGGQKIYAKTDERQISDGRVSSVQYLRFDTGGKVPVAVGCDDPALTVEAYLSEAQRAALEKDLQS